MAKDEHSILAINDLLMGYGDEIQKLIEDEADKIVKEGKKLLKANSPVNKRKTKNRGRYKKGWSIKKVKERGSIKYFIYNKTDWQLTHLLENGHNNRNGTKTGPVIHIKPVNDYCVSEYQKRVENGIKKSGRK